MTILGCLSRVRSTLYIMFPPGQQSSSDADLNKKSSSSSEVVGQPGGPGTGDHAPQTAPVRTVSSRMKNLMRDELLINVHKFEMQV